MRRLVLVIWFLMASPCTCCVHTRGGSSLTSLFSAGGRVWPMLRHRQPHSIGDRICKGSVYQNVLSGRGSIHPSSPADQEHPCLTCSPAGGPFAEAQWHLSSREIASLTPEEYYSVQTPAPQYQDRRPSCLGWLDGQLLSSGLLWTRPQNLIFFTQNDLQWNCACFRKLKRHEWGSGTEAGTIVWLQTHMSLVSSLRATCRLLVILEFQAQDSGRLLQHPGRAALYTP